VVLLVYFSRFGMLQQEKSGNLGRKTCAWLDNNAVIVSLELKITKVTLR
jgi:hypothetical protein